jgi:hypothetical protein
MAEPIVFISRSRLLSSSPGSLEQTFAAAVRLIDSAKPRTALFAAYVDDANSEIRIVHVFPDASAMQIHFEGSEERTQAVAELIQPTDFQIYGDAPADAIDLLRRESSAVGGTVQQWRRGFGGFLRAPA